MKHMFRKIIFFLMIIAIALPFPAMAQGVPAPVRQDTAPLPALETAPAAPTVVQAGDFFTVTVMHTNDFHGNLVPAGSNPGMAKLAGVVNDVRTTQGASNTLLVDVGDEMQGTLLSNLQKGVPTIAAFNQLQYGVATFGNHEFDWGQTVLVSRTGEAQYPYVSANIVVNDGTGGDCSKAGWNQPAFVSAPYVIQTVGASNTIKVGIIGVTSQETPYITLATNTDGLCFKDPSESIQHYYDQMKTDGAQVIVVLSHLGFDDGGYGYGFAVYGDKTLASKLQEAGKPVELILGGHSHTKMSSAIQVGNTTVAHAYYAGRYLGVATISYSPATNTTHVGWTYRNVIDGTPDPAMEALINLYANDPAYQAKINQVIGYTDVPLVRNYNGDNLMGALVNDAIYGALNGDGNAENDADIVFNNAGGLRADITSTVYPYTLTYGATFSVLPFGNATVIGSLTGSQLVELLNQSATLFKGALQVSGVKYKFYRYAKTLPGQSSPNTWAWGAYDIQVKNRNSGEWEALDLSKTYKIATNEFLAPAGGDNFQTFKYMSTLTYWGDMLNLVNAYITQHHGTKTNAYTGPDPLNPGQVDGRIVRDGNDDGGTIVPVTVLHHNDSHGRLLASGSTVGYTNLAGLIKTERQYNPDHTILLSSGDNIQGDSMSFYYKTAAQGFTVDGQVLPPTMTVQPLINAFNAMNYTAMTLGNHEFNFGNKVFTTTLHQANFPILQANLTDDGQYGIGQVPVRPFVTTTLGDVKVAILGIGNHRIPQYELPSNIPGLSFSNPISKAQELAPGLKSSNDVVIALTHIGFTANPKSVEVDSNVDTNLAAQTSGIDAIVGGHSHTPPYRASKFGSGNDSLGAYQYLPAVVGNPDGTPVIINQANRYNTVLGELIIGLQPRLGGSGYDVVSRSGKDIELNTTDYPEDAAIKALLDPYNARLQEYNNTIVGQTTAPIDTLDAFTQETNGANLQADASVFELAQHGITVDFHLSGAMTNRKIADTAAITNPVDVKISDLFSAMPYENSLLALRMNGPQLKRVLERGYRNYYYYKYVPGQGGYSYYTTCMLDINSGGKITYKDTFPTLPTGDNVVSLEFDGKTVDFNDPDTFYVVSTVNYLAAGSCNMSDDGQTLWPLTQLVADTQYYVRDAVIDYMKAQTAPINPVVEGRLEFVPVAQPIDPGTGGTVTDTSHGITTTVNVPANAVTETTTLVYASTPPVSTVGGFGFAGVSFNLSAYRNDTLLTDFTFEQPVVVTIHYTDAAVKDVIEENLVINYWNGTNWVDAATSCTPTSAYVRDLLNNTLSLPICHLSKFAMAGPAPIRMPSIMHLAP